ncbi:hypothetical protein QO232_23050, partial [Vibrio vulnificus]|nr:hypothetical protein [Vibrio vulnificus]
QHDNFATHISTICELYKSRYDVMYAELEKQLPTSCVLKPVDGGMFVWVEIPECDTFELAKSLLANGVAVVKKKIPQPNPHILPDLPYLYLSIIPVTVLRTNIFLSSLTKNLLIFHRLFCQLYLVYHT